MKRFFGQKRTVGPVESSFDNRSDTFFQNNQIFWSKSEND